MKIEKIEKLMTNEQYHDYLNMKNNSTSPNDDKLNDIMGQNEDSPYILCVDEGVQRTDILYAKILLDEEMEKYSISDKVSLFVKSIPNKVNGF